MSQLPRHPSPSAGATKIQQLPARWRRLGSRGSPQAAWLGAPRRLWIAALATTAVVGFNVVLFALRG